jgi:hypothetical protein
MRLLDSDRALLLNQALLARDAETGGDHESITLGTLGYLGLANCSPKQWDLSRDAFDDLQAMYAAWFLETEDIEDLPDVEFGEIRDEWSDRVKLSATAIRSCLNFLVCMGCLRDWTPRERVELERLMSGAVAP